MAKLMVLCPTKRRPFWTKIEINRADQDKPAHRTFAHCPHCGHVHGWEPKDAFFDDELDKWRV